VQEKRRALSGEPFKAGVKLLHDESARRTARDHEVLMEPKKAMAIEIQDPRAGNLQLRVTPE
jgi:hypothetical protein